jgi:hypothetical protein
MVAFEEKKVAVGEKPKPQALDLDLKSRLAASSL